MRTIDANYDQRKTGKKNSADIKKSKRKTSQSANEATREILISREYLDAFFESGDLPN